MIDQFQLPSIDEVPHICLILEIARYMPDEECGKVFKEVIPELTSVYNLVMAERKSKESKEARDFMKRSILDMIPCFPLLNADVPVLKHPCIYVENSENMNILFPDGIDSCFDSIVPKLHKQETSQYLVSHWDEARETLQQVWAGKESLYSLHDNFTAFELLDVSNDETELWHMWSDDIKNIGKLRSDFLQHIESGILLPIQGPCVWLFHDEKIILMVYSSGFVQCIGTRSLSLELQKSAFIREDNQ